MGRQIKAKMGDRIVIIKANKAPKGAPRSKRPGANDSPARRRYWSSNRLEKRKVRAIMEHEGLSEAAASNRWHATRKGRMKTWT